MFDDPRRQHRSRISKVTLKADARQSESRINVSSLERRQKMWKEQTPFCVFGQRSRIVPWANEIPLVNERDLYDTTTAKTMTMTTTRDFAKEKLGRESLLARLCASADNGRCRFLTGSKSTFHILKSLRYIFSSRADRLFVLWSKASNHLKKWIITVYYSRNFFTLVIWKNDMQNFSLNIKSFSQYKSKSQFKKSKIFLTKVHHIYFFSYPYFSQN